MLARRRRPAEDNTVGPHRLGDILDLLRTEVVKDDVELAENLLVDLGGHDDATRFGNPLQPCRDVDAIAQNIVAVDDDVPEVNPDPELNALVRR